MSTLKLVLVLASLVITGCATDPFVQPPAGKTDECSQADGVECK